MSSSEAAAAPTKDPPPAAAAAAAQQQDDDVFSEPDYDHLDLSFASMEEYDADDKHALKKPKKGGIPPPPQYIVGTLIVRIVAARDLEPIQKNGLGQFFAGPNSGTSNPYASVKFAGQTQRTTEIYDTLDPVWPRGETMFLDVSLPLSKVTHGNYNSLNEESVASAAAAAPVPEESEQEDDATIPKPILTVGMFHAMANDNSEKYPTKKQQVSSGDSDEPFLGMASLDVTPLLTGKAVTLDKWLVLTGMSANNNSDEDRGRASRRRRGTVRIVVEYEASDPPPRPGDIVRFSRFCNAADLYPVPPCDAYRVEEVNSDNVILSYTTPEGWLCSFQAHRFMLICEERHYGAVEICQEELASVAERLGQSPLIHTVQETVDRLPQEGLMAVGVDAVRGGASLLERWLKGGVETAAQDLVFATNWDGRFNNNNAAGPAAVGQADQSSPASVGRSSERIGQLKVPQEDEDQGDALPGMPSCPITGEPMINPVVAADGHTYERSAIARWLQTSDKSPLTGAVLSHKDLVPNYMLLSSLSEVEDGKPRARED